MRITDILQESLQLDEAPILNKIGSAVGKAAGTVAKGVGAVAGGVAGLGTAAKKGFQAGKAQVSGAGDEVEPTTATAPQTTPAAKKPGFVSAFKKAVPAGQAYAKARDDAEAAGTPLPKQGFMSKFNQALSAGTAQDTQTAQAGSKLPSQYAQVKASINKLDTRGKQKVLQFLQKSVGSAPTTTAPPAAPAVKPRTGGKVAGEISQTPNAVRKRNARVAAKPVPVNAESVSESYISIFRKV